MKILLLLLVLFIAQGLYRNWGKKTFDALPDHINEPGEWNGKDDDDHWYTKWKKSIKGWFAFGPLSKYSWARFQNYPTFIWGKNSHHNNWRMENDKGETFNCIKPKERNHCGQTGYVSRVQYWVDWHLALEWPLFLHGHYGNWQFYVGFKRDADRVYWLSLYLGRTWK